MRSSENLLSDFNQRDYHTINSHVTLKEDNLVTESLHQTKRKFNFREKLMVTAIFLVLGFLLGISAQLLTAPQFIHQGKANIAERVPTRQVQGINGGVAAEHETCSQIGTQMLQKGGVAIDAAIAGALCVGVVNGFSSGLGGGGFMLIRTANGTVEVIDFREVAPEHTDPEVYTKNPEVTQVTGLSVGVPGELRGFELAHKRHGKLPWKDLFLPSISLARNGFPAGKELTNHIADEAEAIWASEAMREVYVVDGRLATFDDMIYRPRLANTLEIISEQGAQAFYEGDMAASIIETIRAHGGVMTQKDLLNYRPILREPLLGSFDGRKVYTTPAPTSGAILLAILNTMEGYDSTPDDEYTALQYHRLIEAYKYGYAIRTEFADPLYANISSRVAEVMTKGYSDLIRANISDTETFDYQHYNPKFATEELPGTTHLSAISSDTQTVALTSTVNLIFGSKIMDPHTGVLLNNQMDDFSIPHVKNGFDLYPSPANFIAPYKRPLSSTVPTIVETQNEQGVELLVIGGSGGSRIISAVSQVLLHLQNMNLEQAVDYPRLHHQLLPNTLYFEPNADLNLATDLAQFGHIITWWNSTKSSVQAVHRHHLGTITAASDGRKHGMASAY